MQEALVSMQRRPPAARARSRWVTVSGSPVGCQSAAKSATGRAGRCALAPALAPDPARIGDISPAYTRATKTIAYRASQDRCYDRCSTHNLLGSLTRRSARAGCQTSSQVCMRRCCERHDGAQAEAACWMRGRGRHRRSYDGVRVRSTHGEERPRRWGRRPDTQSANAWQPGSCWTSPKRHGASSKTHTDAG